MDLSFEITKEKHKEFKMEIQDYKQGVHPVVGEFSVYMPKMKLKISRLKLVRSKAGNLFISYPSFKRDNSEDWVSYFRWDDSADKIFKNRLMELLKPLVDSPPPAFEETDEIPF